MGPDELSPSQAAQRIGTTTRSIQRWIALGRLPARRVGGRWRVATVALDAFVAGSSASPPDAGAASGLTDVPWPGARGPWPGTDVRRADARAPRPDPNPVHRQPRRDRPADHAHGDAPRHHRGRATDGWPGALDLLDKEAVVRAARTPARTHCTRVSASWPSTPTSRRRSSRPASAGSARRRPRFARWATRQPLEAWPFGSAFPSFPGTRRRSIRIAMRPCPKAGGADRLPVAREAGRRWWRQGDACPQRPRWPRHRAGGRAARGCCRLW